jgi:hypothetical protein
MDRVSASVRTWSNDQLKDAVAAARNWRDVMRALGLRADSAGTVRIMKRHVASLGLDTSHFRGKRSWSDAQLRRAVIDAQSWDELLTALGLAMHSGDGRVRRGTPSTAAWVRDQVELYEGSGGTQGTTLRDTGLPVVIVTNRGAKSGRT